ncbi:YgaP family membrane protein [Natronosalvus rutilus]|uniref:DUF2892 domain-containing protein n=1 Tax=Natronosalvus rutilus TaxID=2953753 RepID=A0A9E7NE49_9EURY|nr:DUF2892 domain-containing protein [Natronosalvus rutilus]UTF55218.1 DUF2892 domain-containing protein [Natronosalvus rutilus]
MVHNVGSSDSTVRVIAGALVAVLGAAILLGFLEAGALVGVVALVIGVVLVGTGLTRTCLVYRVLGIDTSKRM